MPTWTALSIAPDRARAEALGGALEAVAPSPTGVGVFEIEDGRGDWEVGGYFLAPPDNVALSILAAAHGARDFVVSKIPDTDWVAKVRRELSPVHAGRFIVYGGHDADAVSEHLIGLRVEAAMAFGTGHHETTRGCLLALDALSRALPRPRRVADIGCGTAVLAIAAAKRWRASCTASDIDPQAVATARENVRVNAEGPRVRCVEAAGFRHTALREGPRFDLVLANILARPLKRLAPDMAARCAPGGVIILSGILDRQAAAVVARYTAWGFSLERRIHLGQWTTLVMRRNRG
jgi:ribosomal protein L11 methyltransferase